MKLREGYVFVMEGEEAPCCGSCGKRLEPEMDCFLDADDNEICVNCADNEGYEY